MSTSRFIQGESYPVLKRYNDSNSLQDTVNLPHVAATDNSFVKQWFAPYPANEVRHHEILGGYTVEDSAIGHIFNCTIYYKTIETETLKDILNCIILAQRSGYLRITPHYDLTLSYKVVYLGDVNIETKTRWLHNIELNFKGMDIITNLNLTIPVTAS